MVGWSRRTLVLAWVLAPQVLAVAADGWPAGEGLRYRVSFGPITAGEATLAATGPVDHEGHPCWLLSAEVVTGRLVSSLCRVRDRFECVADTASLACARVQVSILEGGYRERFGADIDLATGAAIDDRGRRRDLPPGCRDLLGAWLHVRRQALAVGDTLSLPVLTGRRLARLWLRVAGRESVATANGPRECLVVAASFGDLDAERLGHDALVHLTDDRRHLPVRIEVAAFLGTLVATLLPESASPP